MNGSSSYATAAAVLVGAALIALVLRSGLRDVSSALERAAAPAARAAAGSQPAPVSQAATPAPSGSEAEVPAERLERDRRARLRDLMLKELASQKETYRKACVPSGPFVPGRVPTLELALTLGADGVELRREFRQLGPGEPAVTECVKKTKVAPIRVQAPGEETTISLPFMLF